MNFGASAFPHDVRASPFGRGLSAGMASVTIAAGRLVAVMGFAGTMRLAMILGIVGAMLATMFFRAMVLAWGAFGAAIAAAVVRGDARAGRDPAGDDLRDPVAGALRGNALGGDALGVGVLGDLDAPGAGGLASPATLSAAGLSELPSAWRAA